MNRINQAIDHCIERKQNVRVKKLFPNRKIEIMIDPNVKEEEQGAPTEDEGAEQTSNDQLPGASELVD